jgi:hypothetical protein
MFKVDRKARYQGYALHGTCGRESNIKVKIISREEENDQGVKIFITKPKGKVVMNFRP